MVGYCQRRPQRPPDIARVRDDLGADQRIDVFAVVLVGAEQLGQAGARQFVVGGQPIADEAGEVALPERRRCRQRQQQRQIGRQPHDQIDAGVDVRHLDMHVHAAQHVAVADHLQVVHDRAVARLRRHRSARARRRAGRCPWRQAPACARPAACAERAAVMRPDARALRCALSQGGVDHLDLRLQHLGRHAVAERLVGAVEEALVDAAHGAARARVEHEIFLFHAEACTWPRRSVAGATGSPAHHPDAKTAAGRERPRRPHSSMGVDDARSAAVSRSPCRSARC